MDTTQIIIASHEVKVHVHAPAMGLVKLPTNTQIADACKGAVEDLVRAENEGNEDLKVSVTAYSTTI